LHSISDDGIVVVEVKKGGEMEVDDVSPALRDRLGPEATLGLVALLDKARHQWSAAVTERAVDRYDARLTAEMSQLRIDVKQDIHELRDELKQDIHGLRVEFKHDINDLRVELKQDINDLRGELKRDITDLRIELKHDTNELRVELKGDISKLDASVSTALLNQTRWMFGMWVGQLAATAAIVAGMFRIFTQ
jgi:Protein of unknown function (DUF1640)